MAKKKAGKKYRILAVDDNPDVIYSIEEGLTSLCPDYEVIGARSGKECLNILKTLKPEPDLILLDIMMPGMDGWDVCAKIKGNKKTEDLPIIFLTAKTDVISKSMGKLASKDYIEKPFETIDLKKRVAKVLRKNAKAQK